MSKAFGIAFGCAVAVIGVLVWVGFSSTRGNHLAPTGHIGKVRVQRVEDGVSFVVVDFNVKNDSDRNFVVRDISIGIDRPEGAVEGEPVAAPDLEGAFHAYPELGPRFNPVMRLRDVLPAHREVDLMVGGRFDLPADKVENHKLTLRVQDVTGAEFVLTK